MRVRVKKRRDKRIFARTARKVAKANLSSSSYRGGIRL